MINSELKKQFNFYIKYYKNHYKNISLSFFLTLIQTFSLIPIALLIQYVFDHSLPEKNSNQLFSILGAVFVLFIVNSAAILWNRDITLSTIKSIMHLIRRDLVENALYLNHQFYANADIDKTQSKIVQDTERMDCMISALLTQFIPGVLIVTGLSFLLIYLNAFLFLTVFCIMPILFIMVNFINKKVKVSIKKFHSDFSEYSKGVSFVLKFSELIKLSTAESKELDRQDNNIKNLKNSSHKMAWLVTAHNVTQTNLLTLSGVIVLLVGGLQVINNKNSIGELLSFYVALGLLSTNMKIVLGTLPTVIEGRESINTLMSLLENNNFKNLSDLPFKGLRTEIRFENVHFSYNSNFSLNNINFKIDKNEVIGIFGASGSGKSTIINLLLGFYQPQSGKIIIDENNLSDINLIDYRKKIGVLSQDSIIFPGTIKENLIYGLSQVNEEDIIAVCKLCNIHNHIINLKKGYDSEIGERGVKISGGQKQRIAIARALLRQPQLLILDEPENNLDEELIFEIIRNIKSLNMTLLLISHNIRMQKYLDRVYEFDNKELIEKNNNLVLKNEIV